MNDIQGTTHILPEQLKKARESLGLSVREAASLIGVQPEKLVRWETGSSSPEAEDLWNLAEVYGRSTLYFLAETGNLPVRQDFRQEAVATREAFDVDTSRLIIAEFEELCRTQHTLETLLEKPRKPSIEPTGDSIRDPEELATFIRKRFRIGLGPIRGLRALLEGRGIKVFGLAFRIEGLSGTSWWHQEYGPAILFNRREVEGRRVFTMAHELAHLLRSGNQVFCGYLTFGLPEETFADRFAASFLMPEDDLIEFVQQLPASEELSGWDTPDNGLDRIARRYTVSREALAWRLENLEMLPSGFTRNLRERSERASRWFRGAKGEQWRRRAEGLGGTYLSLVREAHGKRLISLSAVAEMIRVDIVQASEWVETEGKQQTGHRPLG